MKLTYVKTNNFIKSMINSIKELMLENNLTEVSLVGTVFEKKARWNALVIENDELKVFHKANSLIHKDWTHDFEFVNRYDIIKLQQIVLEILEEKFSKDC